MNKASSQSSDLERAYLAGKKLYEGDRASQALGIRMIETTPGRASVAMRVRADMLNGHRVCHGGLIFTLADTAFAFACNSYGANTLAAAGSIDFLAPGREGDELTATASELWRSGRSGLYEVEVTNQRGERIALFRGRSQQVAGNLLDPKA
ncbi:MAG TPA: hydroxyphenylacetyl-CoA thioesterase PaaI [Steroidobacteraceae bacterium]|nr:hydroxyphenylacetyl-CoA thioesterase PaaI [Steroidobacteraceae bacterium]